MITPDSPEYKNLTDEGKEAILEQIERVTTACQKVGVLASQHNFDQVYTELCRDRYDENELMLFNEADFFYAAHNIKERLEVDETLQRRQEREAAAKELARQQERAARLRQKDMEAGLNPHGHRSKEQEQADEEAARQGVQKFVEQRKKELQDTAARTKAADASAREIEENPIRFVPNWEGEGASPDVLRKLPNNVLRLYVRKRAEYERQLAVAENEARKKKPQQ